MKRICLFSFAFIIFLLKGSSQADSAKISFEFRRFMELRTKFSGELLTDYYSFIDYSKNYIDWGNENVLDNFLKVLGQSEFRKVKVLHIGDSHIHSDIFTGYVRQRLQNIFGSGGRGLLFPYCAAGTHATRDYRTVCSGNWTSAKATEKVMLYDVGVTGVTARTEDIQATASIIFRNVETSVRNETVSVSMLYHPANNAFDAQISSGGNTWKILRKDEVSGVIYGEIECFSDTLTISFSRSDSVQNFFELYGLIVEYKNKSGLIYHAAGINGAAIQHLSGQKLIEKHLSIIQPDLLILDLGTNDIYKGYFNEVILEKLITAAIMRIKSVLPEINILLMTPQDMYYRRKHVVTTEKFSLLMKKIAFDQHCAFYNFFEISGGNYSMLQWEKQLLAKKDRIHLTTGGYELKGKLFVIAFLDMYLKYIPGDKNIHQASWASYDSVCVAQWFEDVKIYKNKQEVVSNFEVYPEAKESAPNSNQNFHIVKSGESLGIIAQKYGISVAQIQQMNGLGGTTIYPGQKLFIHAVQQPGSTSAEANSDYDKQGIKTTDNTLIYTVKSGDSLYKIARSHGVSVQAVKDWNNLSSDRIFPGQKLEILKK